MITEDKLAKKSDRINFQKEAVMREFAPNRSVGKKRWIGILVLAVAIIAVAVVGVKYVIDNKPSATE